VSNKYHTPVLCNEAVEYLVTAPEGIYVDGTLGGGGHAEAIMEKIYPHGSLLAIDTDADAQKTARERLRRFESKILFVHENTVNIRSILHANHISSIQGLLLDLGVSSHQLDEAARGFTFRMNDVLDMRMDQRQQLNAGTVLNTYSEEDLASIFWNYGEESASRRVARMIVKERMKKPITTTGQLVSLIERCTGRAAVKTLARIFQALRIEVNNELENLSRILEDSLEFLAPNARIVVISYHSLEDRIVKNFFLKESATSIRSGHQLIPDTPRVPRLRTVTRKPVTASEKEQHENRRARSAKLRVAEGF
jgi:16S rRNA (cytosine1402-N4)-methyltransferase